MQEICLIYIKHEGIGNECEQEIFQHLKNEEIKIHYTKDVILSEYLLKKHQPILFTEEKQNEFWKHQSVERMLNKKIKALLVSSNKCIEICNKIKKTIRNKYTPKYDEINKVSYPTYMHSASNKLEVERDVFYLMPEQLEFLKSINGVNEYLINLEDKQLIKE